jgi:hypothetical protein
MPSLMSKISQFARSPKGREMTGQAKRFASKPENRRKVENAWRKFAKKR